MPDIAHINTNPPPQQEDDNSSTEFVKLKDNVFSHITRDILVGLREGDYEAFDFIYMRCVGPLAAFFRVLMQSDTDARELCQDLFMKIWETREKINPDSNFKAYIYTTAKNLALMQLRHKKVIHKFINFKLKNDIDFEYAPDSELIRAELMLLMKISLNNMNPVRKRVFEMSRIEGLNNDEIAKKLNLNPVTVRTHLHKAIKELKNLIALTLIFIPYE